MSLRNPFAPSLSSWCRFWASTPSSRRRSPLMCRLQSWVGGLGERLHEKFHLPYDLPLRRVDRLYQWLASKSVLEVGLLFKVPTEEGYINPMTACEPEVLLLVFVLSTKSAVYRLCFYTICPNNKVDKLKRLPNLWQQLGSLIWKNNKNSWTKTPTKYRYQISISKKMKGSFLQNGDTTF